MSYRPLMSRKPAMVLSLATAALLLVLLYVLSIFLKETPDALALEDRILEEFFLANQTVRSLEIEIIVTEGRRLNVRSRYDVSFEKGDGALYFLLNSAFDVASIDWKGKSLTANQNAGTIWRIPLPAALAAAGEGTLEISCTGVLHPRTFRSVLSPDLIYLDPDDVFHPRLSPGVMDVTIRATFPAGFRPVACSEMRELAGENGAARFEWALPRRVTTFSVAGCRAAPWRHSFGDTEISLFPIGRTDAVARTDLAALAAFFGARLPAHRPESMRIVVAPASIEEGIRCDGAGTVVVNDGISPGDLAFVFGLLWIPPLPEEDSLFSREEMALAWSLYFLGHDRPPGDRLACLERGDILRPGHSVLPRPGLSGGLLAGPLAEGAPRVPGRGVRHGGTLLDLLRHLLGDGAFDSVCREALAAKGAAGAGFWKEACARRTDRDLSWFFSDFVGNPRALDLAVTRFEVEHLAEKEMFEFRIEVSNLGDAELPERVLVTLVTAETFLRKRMVVTGDGRPWKDVVVEEVVGVIVDPDYEWPDADRSNNVAFLDPRPTRILPSADNRYLAKAFRRVAGQKGAPFEIDDLKERNSRTIRLEAPVTGMTWINGHTLVVRTGGSADGATASGSNQILVDAKTGGVSRLGRDVRVSPAPSGEYILINERRGERWHHRLLSLDERRERPILNSIFYRLAFIGGDDLIKVIRPGHAERKVVLYGVDGERAFDGIQTGGMELSEFEGYDGGVFFLGREHNRVHFVYVPRGSPGAVAEYLFTFENREVRYRLDRTNGYVYFFERELTSDVFVASRCDLDRPLAGGREKLCEGSPEVPRYFLGDRGFLRVDNAGTRLLFRAFDGSGVTEIAAEASPLEILGLAGNPGRRILYYAREELPGSIPARWSGLDLYKRQTFFRYDFRKGEARELALGSPAR